LEVFKAHTENDTEHHMDQLINSLPALMKAAGNAEQIRETAAAVAWNHVAGEGLRQHAVPVGLRQQTLIVAVADQIWRRQLESMRGQLLFRLSSLLGRGVVTFIEFQIDPSKVQAARASRADTENVRRKSDAEMAVPFELLSAAAAIHDRELRKAFLGAAMSCARRLGESEI